MQIKAKSFNKISLPPNQTLTYWKENSPHLNVCLGQFCIHVRALLKLFL
jgi:hypothetical protein